MPIEVDDLPEFEVNSILDSKFWRRKLHYKVDWLGYNDSWEPAENLTNADLAVNAFHARYPDKPRPPLVSS